MMFMIPQLNTQVKVTNITIIYFDVKLYTHGHWPLNLLLLLNAISMLSLSLQGILKLWEPT